MGEVWILGLGAIPRLHLPPSLPLPSPLASELGPPSPFSPPSLFPALLPPLPSLRSRPPYIQLEPHPKSNLVHFSFKI